MGDPTESYMTDEAEGLNTAFNNRCRRFNLGSRAYNRLSAKIIPRNRLYKFFLGNELQKTEDCLQLITPFVCLRNYTQDIE